ncbi:hypothetical protein KKD62_00710 [Patescibacteria group bacterium]|nr:hypothetical protein [Patescibacteria group bacterium]MBU1931455.1 hypothetical protein [Patescibacteria group bacterium]
MRIKVGIMLLVFAGFLIMAAPVEAAKKRVRKKSEAGGGSVNFGASRGVKAHVRFRPDRRALLIDFSGFDNLESGSYQLVYDANGISQGAGGSVISNDTGTKTLLFGTCSSGVCHYHQNITNMRLSITSVLKNGTTVLKPYRIRP